jgi:hypothetical protein
MCWFYDESYKIYSMPLMLTFGSIITAAIKHHNPDVGARRAVPRLGEARLAPYH